MDWDIPALRTFSRNLLARIMYASGRYPLGFGEPKNPFAYLINTFTTKSKEKRENKEQAEVREEGVGYLGGSVDDCSSRRFSMD